MARAQRVRIPSKERKTSAPRRIGRSPCRVGPPTRHGSSSKGPNPPKESKTNAPCRIGRSPCRDGPPTRRGTNSKAPKRPKIEENERATSHWESAMSRWTSNATWHELKGAETPQNRGKRACHVVLGGRHVVLGLQRDVARAQRRRNAPKERKTSAPRRIVRSPCRVGPPTRRGSHILDSIIL